MNNNNNNKVSLLNIERVKPFNEFTVFFYHVLYLYAHANLFKTICMI